MVRVLHVVPSLDINAGMMSVVMNYYRNLNRGRIQFDFIYLYDADENYSSEIKRLGGRTYKVGAPSFSKAFTNEINAFFDAHNNEYNILHCHPIWAPVFFAGPAKKHGVKHIISHSHSTKYSEKRLSAIRNKIFLPVIKALSTDFMACSEDAAKLFGSSYKNKVSIITNAIDTDTYLFCEDSRREIRRELSIEEDDVIVGHVGRFSVEKNHSFLLDAFKAYSETEPRAKLMLVGDGPLADEIFNRVISLGLESKVILTGIRYDVEKLLSAMDVFVLPSLFEGVPVVAIEAQASGLPCVISDTVTKKINFGKCRYVSISSGCEPWSAALKECVLSMNNRCDASMIISDSDYNIKNSARYLEELYLSMNG